MVCLVLAVALTFNAVRLVIKGKNQTSQNAINPEILGASDVKQTNGEDSLQFTTYTILKGDTLFNISQKFNISWTTLATLNNLKSPFYLKPGQTLKVPKQ